LLRAVDVDGTQLSGPLLGSVRFGHAARDAPSRTTAP